MIDRYLVAFVLLPLSTSGGGFLSPPLRRLIRLKVCQDVRQAIQGTDTIAGQMKAHFIFGPIPPPQGRRYRGGRWLAWRQRRRVHIAPDGDGLRTR